MEGALDPRLEVSGSEQLNGPFLWSCREGEETQVWLLATVLDDVNQDVLRIEFDAGVLLFRAILSESSRPCTKSLLEGSSSLPGLGGVCFVNDDRIALLRQVGVSDPINDEWKCLQRDRDDFRLTRKSIGQLRIFRSPLSLHGNQCAHNTLKLLHRCRELLVQHPPVGDNHDLLEDLLVVGVVKDGESMSKPGNGV